MKDYNFLQLWLRIFLWIIAFQLLAGISLSVSTPGPWYYNLIESPFWQGVAFLHTTLAVFGFNLWQKAIFVSEQKKLQFVFVLQMLINYIPEVREVVESSLSQENNDTKTLLRHVHKLYGSIAYCGVPRLKQICSTLEKRLNSGSSISILDLESELFELQDEMEKVTKCCFLFGFINDSCNCVMTFIRNRQVNILDLFLLRNLQCFTR